jgi:YVTN family beta-propeller protein
MRIHFTLLVTLTVAAGCTKDPASISVEVPVPSAKGVYVVNEGTWGRGNASLTYYDLETFQAYTDVFGAVNGRALGDVGNQMVVLNERGYIVVNNSDRIEIIDIGTHRSEGAISLPAGSSPRQIAFVGDSILMVTALYDNSVLLFSVEGRALIGRIPVGANPEGIVVTNGKAYVANSGLGSGNTLSIISLASRTVTSTIPIGDNPSGVALSADGMVYIVCGGFYNDFADPNDDTPATIAVVNPATDAVVASLVIGGHASTIALTSDGRGYVPTSDRVVTIDTRSRSVTGTFRTGYFYGIGVEEVSGDVYLTDPKNFVLPGEVLVYAATGQFRTKFTAGVIPGSIAFKR